MKIEVGSVDFLDDFDESDANPATCHCLIEIGESPAQGFDLFFANVSNRKWAKKHLENDQLGFCCGFLIVERLDETQVRRAIQSSFGKRDFERFEDFVEIVRPFLRWEFEGYHAGHKGGLDER